jgi:hypothetical protein
VRVERRFRATQNADGGWGYMLPARRAAGMMMGSASRATMTCAGLLGVLAGHGAAADVRKRRDPKAEPRDVSKDKVLKAGLAALGGVIGEPTGDPRKAAAAGRAYYFLWSLERVAVILDLKTIGKKDWYGWGAEVLLANQQGDGTWRGEYGDCGADTAFALLFLKKSNLATDLSARIRGPGDAGEKVLRAGGVGAGGLKGGPALKGSGIGEKSGEGEPVTTSGKKSPGERSSRPRSTEESAVDRLAEGLVKDPERRDELLEKLREGKGSAYTEGLAGVIPRLDGPARRKAREALAERLTRMKADTLRAYLKDEEPEIRRAAALACAMKDDKQFVPALIGLLDDPEPLVERAAHAALKALTREDFGPKSGADRDERDKAVAAWRAWWEKHGRE